MKLWLTGHVNDRHLLLDFVRDKIFHGVGYKDICLLDKLPQVVPGCADLLVLVPDQITSYFDMAAED